MKMQDYTIIWERWTDGRNRYTLCATGEVLEASPSSNLNLNEVILPMLYVGGATCGTVTIKVQPVQEVAVKTKAYQKATK